MKAGDQVLILCTVLEAEEDRMVAAISATLYSRGEQVATGFEIIAGMSKQ